MRSGALGACLVASAKDARGTVRPAKLGQRGDGNRQFTAGVVGPFHVTGRDAFENAIDLNGVALEFEDSASSLGFLIKAASPRRQPGHQEIPINYNNHICIILHYTYK